jgi:SAM-dependent methyltransferase
LTLGEVQRCQKRLQTWMVKRFCVEEMRQRAEEFTNLFESHLSPSSQVLDIGGGWGFYFEPFHRRGHYLTVLDVQKPGYQKAPVVLYDPRNPFPFPDKSFDVSLLVTMLHHVRDPEKVLAEAKRVTRRTVFVVEDLYHHALGRWWTVLRDRLYNFEFFGHPCQFKKSHEWEIVFNQAGLSVQFKQELYTRLAGLRILNGVFVLRADS